MPIVRAKISIDGMIFIGYASAARVLVTDRSYMKYIIQLHKGDLVFKGRKVKVLNFKEIANSNYAENRRTQYREGARRYRKTSKWKDYIKKYRREKKKNRLSTKE